jgi:hypothetical protein
MTDTTLANPAPASDSAWSQMLAEYREACTVLHAEVASARHSGNDINQTAAEAHAWAARALIETPATHIVHIGQKIRAADNLVNLAQLYPRLPDILLRDLFGLIGIDAVDQRLLPFPLQ